MRELQKIKIGIAEDNSRIRQLFHQKINSWDDYEVVICAENGFDLLEKLSLEKNHIDLVLMDIQMPQMNGIEATKIIKQQYTEIKVIALTTFSDEDKLVEMVCAGASGYLLKDISQEELKRSIMDVLNGGISFTPTMARKLLSQVKHTAENNKITNGFNLTKREIDVLELIKMGMLNKEVAEKLFISSQTVKKHLENIYKKLQVNNRMEAIAKIQKH